MARVAEYRNDLSGATVTSDATVVSTASNKAFYLFTAQGFDTLAHLDKNTVSFTPNVTNGNGPVTLNVDSLGSKPLRPTQNVELSAGVLVAGTPYIAVYNNSDGVFYLSGYYNHPALTPLAGQMDYWGTTAPSSAYAFPAGQTLSRTTYAALFALIGTTYGTGANDGLTFSLPDVRGRVTAAPDNMGGSDANRLSGDPSVAPTRNSIGGGGGASSHTLTVSEIPNGLQVSSNGSAPVSGSVVGGVIIPGGGPAGLSTTTTQVAANSGSANIAGTATIAGLAGVVTNTGNQPHGIMQPTILCNKIMRIL